MENKDNIKQSKPAKTNKRLLHHGLRLNSEEAFVIRQKASSAGLTFSNYIRKMAMYGIVKPIMDEEEKNILRQLVGMANNINQMAKQANKQQLLYAMVDFEKYRNEIDKILLSLKNHQNDK